MRRQHPFRPPDRRQGRDPDYRFSLANERTFLAWIRTSLALVGGGLAISALLPAATASTLRDAVGMALVVFGTVLAGASFARWARNEDAMRHDRPIPASVLPLVLSLGVLVVAGMVVVLVLGVT